MFVALKRSGIVILKCSIFSKYQLTDNGAHGQDGLDAARPVVLEQSIGQETATIPRQQTVGRPVLGLKLNLCHAICRFVQVSGKCFTLVWEGLGTNLGARDSRAQTVDILVCDFYKGKICRAT